MSLKYWPEEFLPPNRYIVPPAIPGALAASTKTTDVLALGVGGVPPGVRCVQVSWAAAEPRRATTRNPLMIADFVFISALLSVYG
jgi:hypothetical protein